MFAVADCPKGLGGDGRGVDGGFGGLGVFKPRWRIVVSGVLNPTRIAT